MKRYVHCRESKIDLKSFFLLFFSLATYELPTYLHTYMIIWKGDKDVKEHISFLSSRARIGILFHSSIVCLFLWLALHVHVCYVLLVAPLWLYPWKGTVSTGIRREREPYQRSPIVPTTQANLDHAANLSRTLWFGWETMNRYSSTVPGPFCPSWSRTTSQPGEVIKSSTRRIHCKIRVHFFWVGAGRHCRRWRKYCIWPMRFHQPQNYSSNLGYHMLELQGTLRPTSSYVPTTMNLIDVLLWDPGR